MDRIIIHWTAGGNKANATDKKHYHVLVEGDGRVVLGDHPIKANKAPLSKAYAAHTLNCNTGSIGVSLCGMVGAVESPFKPGNAPITKVQFDAAIKEVARLAKEHGIAVSPKTILTHAEVEANLGIKQRGKWDITILPWDTKVKGAKVVGDLIRAGVAAELTPKPPPKPKIVLKPYNSSDYVDRTPPGETKAWGLATALGAAILFLAAVITKGFGLV
jgi:N-acetyl-anhydromuramyl-L-alanine amidase AmpD